MVLLVWEVGRELLAVSVAEGEDLLGGEGLVLRAGDVNDVGAVHRTLLS